MNKQARSIYIHLPFCKTKCPYCDFASFADHKVKDIQDYTQALLNEIDLRMPKLNSTKPKIETLFLGGGTPSLYPKQELRRILQKLEQYFIWSDNLEFTVEANPGTIDREGLLAMQSLGCNRVSLGVQTLDENLLAKLGRGHSVDDSLRSIEDIKSCGFKSWSVDLIYGLPGQSLKSWQGTVDQALVLVPEHISAYALSIEPGTPFASIYQNSNHEDLPSEADVIAMYNYAQSKFAVAGLKRYEISNWARDGHKARHNLTYWLAEHYYAFGLSAHGYVEQTRYYNTRDFREYLGQFLAPCYEFQNKSLFSFVASNCEQINPQEALKEELLLGLRLDDGVKLNSLHKNLLNRQKLDYYITNDYLTYSESKIALKDKAVLVSNKVIADLLLGS